MAIILLCFAACGCAAEQAATELPIATVANPAKGAAYRLTIVDKRRFAPTFEKASRPSLAPATDAAVRDRIFGRPEADAPPLLLASDTDVRRVAYRALGNALKASGYRVVGADDPAFAAATPLTAELESFWAWSVTVPPDPATVYYYECKVDLRLVGGWPLVEGSDRRVLGSEWMFKTDAADAYWGAVLTECLGEVDYVLKGALQKPGQS